ncbi:MAG TPA: hypothetical protein VFH63_01225 [candidate division Zixibacteria bacterium]|nr:hypothetical protein [candidate division Zixibacteria bacterium]
MAGRNRHGESFEQLFLLRLCYPYRSDYDARGTMTVDETIAYAEHLLRMARIREQWTGWGERGPAPRTA